MEINLKKILPHVFGCVVFMALPILFSPDNYQWRHLLSVNMFVKDFFSYFLILLFFYGNVYAFLPTFFAKKKYVLYIILLILSFLCIIYLPIFVFGNVAPPAMEPHVANEHKPDFDKDGMFFIKDIEKYFVLYICVLLFSFLLQFYNKWQQVEKEKNTAELNFLKAQINPHFLFNTLNSIYASAIDEKANTTATAVVKLSNMMRYVVTDASENYVSIENEINYISNYIDMQKMRLGNTVQINYSHTSPANAHKIAPLLLMSFIENTFKHGVNAEENSTINIAITCTENCIVLHTQNNKVKVVVEKSGLGIANAVKRLDMLYPNAYDLQIKDNELNYIVQLKINY